MNLSKPKLFLFGGCDLRDIAKNDGLQRDFDVIDFSINHQKIDNTFIDFSHASFPETSIMSLYTKPGPIAHRILDTLATAQKGHMIINKNVVNEILKFPYLDFYKQHAGPNDYLLISFSPEIYTKYASHGEIFTCMPSMSSLENPDNILHWVYKEYLQKPELLMPFDTKESIEMTSQIMIDFARDLYEIFQDRVILIKTHFSNYVLSKDSKITKIQPGPSNLLYYRQTKVITEPTDLSYVERLSMIITNKFRTRYKSDLTLIQLNEPVFIDGNHRWGSTQFHIDVDSRNKIAKLVRAELKNKISNYEQKFY
jgi:hypothetical protein